MKYMHAIGQHERLSLANGLLQADKLRTVSQGMPGVRQKKKKDIRISKLKIECQPTERIFEYSGPALLNSGPSLLKLNALTIITI